MRHAIFAFSTPNLGDEVQALAAALLLPRVDAYVDRDRLDKVRLKEVHAVIMNSWFAVKRYRAVPSVDLRPYYFGQCVGRSDLLNPDWIAEWKRHEPIGCRDTHSVALLRDQGIDARFTGCLTTWMGRFLHPPVKREGVVFVDVPEALERFIPEDIRRRASRITNATAKRGGTPRKRFERAAELCDVIRTAEMVVTRRLHTALPCVGFGTPVSVYLKAAEGNRARFSGSDRFLPIVFHDGERPLADGPTWIAPQAVTVTADMEAHFQALCAHFGTPDAPRWTSMAECVATLPDVPRAPRSLLERLLGATA